MHVDQITDVQALAAVGGILVFAWIVYRLVPQPDGAPRRRRTFEETEVTAYDAALPKYFLAALGALVLGGVHAVVKSLPPIYAWLAGGGHGGHMVRDLANTHLVIVIGGTVAATGLVWYALPRIVRRPLFSQGLATWSLWLTVIGAGGFYVANVVLGVVFARLAHDGIGYDQAKPMLGLARSLPIGISSGIMGVGYWTFVANVILTIAVARDVPAPRAERHLLKFFAVGALGLFIGTVQGVIQVLPSNEAWLHAAAPAGEYIDPIAHAHVNLVTGTLSLVAGLGFWAWRARQGNGSLRVEQAVFWTMVPGSILFYLTFMGLGFTEGHLVADRGFSFAQAVAILGPFHVVPLMTAGILTLTGVWLLLATLVRRYAGAAVPGRGLIVVGAAGLAVGTAQGLVQLLPAAKAWLVSAEDAGDWVANAHAQLNMLGGVLPALFGILLVAAPGLIGGGMSPGRERRATLAIGGGIGLYYLAAVTNAIVVGELVRAGHPDQVAVVLAGPWGALGMALGAGTYAYGWGCVAIHAWRATGDQRHRAWLGLQQSLAAVNGDERTWRRELPVGRLVAAELVGAGLGFPGFGWILAGLPLIGVPVALAGPAIAWAIVPILMSPYGDGPFAGIGVTALLAWIVVSTTVTSTALAVWLLLARRRRTPRLVDRG